MTDQGTHLMDVVQWFTGTGAPKSAMSHGYVAKNDRRRSARSVFSAIFDYGSFMATWTLNYCNSYEDGWSILLQGDEATMRMDDAGFVVWKEPWKSEPRTPVMQDEGAGADRDAYPELPGLHQEPPAAATARWKSPSAPSAGQFAASGQTSR
jgi:predicted dehydrogenase